ncbi:hypothetical protein BH18THE2_BH18THE2_07110 [soil metagenome]
MRVVGGILTDIKIGPDGSSVVLSNQEDINSMRSLSNTIIRYKIIDQELDKIAN